MSLVVRNTKEKGRGVFTDRLIHKGEIVEVCPVIPLCNQDYNLLSRTVLLYHMFNWPDEPYAGACIVLGLGSIINHDDNPNTEWKANIKQRTVTFVALRNIEKGTEITHDYKWDADMWE